MIFKFLEFSLFCHSVAQIADFLFQMSEIQVRTRHMLVLIAKLQKQRQILETLKDEDKSIWDQKVKEIERVKVNVIPL